MASKENAGHETWKKRWLSAEAVHEEHDKVHRVNDCYNYWKGNQLVNATDKYGVRRAQVNKIHPEVRNQLPSLYFYRPFARIVPQPELEDTPGSDIDSTTQLLQDTVNHLIRIKHTRFRESTHLALKESFWSMGVVEVGYSAEFMDDPGGDRPALKERKDTKLPAPPKDKVEPKPGQDPEEAALEAEVAALKKGMKSERFYVKHITAEQFMVSDSDKATLEDNDWVGYWEDVPLSDVREAGKRGVYKNTGDLRASGSDSGDTNTSRMRWKQDNDRGITDRVRLFRVWSLREMVKYVWAENHAGFLLKEDYARLPLKTLRFDLDPYHFYPIPPIEHKLGPQDEYNLSRDWLRKLRNGYVPRFTYDEDAVDAEQMQKLEKGIINQYIPRHAGTSDPIQPVNQPMMNEGAIQTLTLSDKEFNDVGGVGGDPKIAQQKSATQAKIAEVKEQVQDSFDRQLVARWLGEISEELLMLAIDHMLLEQWVQVNVAQDSMYAEQESQKVAQQYQMVTGEKLRSAATGLEYDVIVDMESLSPVSEEEKFQKLMTGIQFIADERLQRVFAVAPDLLVEVLKGMGIQNARKVAMITGAMEKLLEIQMQQAAAGSPPPPGMSPQPSGGEPGMPSPEAQQDTPGGPQPGGPVGPGASVPS